MKTYYQILLVLLLVVYINNQCKSQIAYPSATEVLYTNKSKITINNEGSLWSYGSRGGQYYVDYDNTKPDTLNPSMIFTAGLWMSANSTSSSHIAAKHYNAKRDYYAGPIDATGIVSITSTTLWNRIFTCKRNEIITYKNYLATYGTPLSLSYIPTNLLQWPAKGNPHLVATGMVLDHELAPFIDANADGIYNPVYGDYPCIKGDEAMFYCINDKGPEDSVSGKNLEVEIHVMNYAYRIDGIVDHTTFYDVTVVNRSTNNYHDFQMGLFVDNDLGCYDNDYIGCQPDKNLAVIYNGVSRDPNCSGVGFGYRLPIAGVKLLQSPLNTLGVQTGMTSFGYFNNALGATGDPNNVDAILHRLSGTWSDGTAYTTNGIGYGGLMPTKFVYPGNPADSTEWSECHNQVDGRNRTADRRFLMTSGPYSMATNERLKYTYAVFASYLDSNEVLYPNFDSTINPLADSVQEFYDSIKLYCNDGVLGIHDVSAHRANAIVFPNPLLGNQLNLVLDQDMLEGSCDMSILDISGKLIYKDKIEVQNRSASIDLSSCNLVPAYYTLILRNNLHQVQAKFIK